MPVIQFGSDQSGFNMHLLILFLCCWVCEGVRCPFPGITATAEFVDVSTIQTNRTFHQGDVVEYHCPGDWQRNFDQKYSLTCQSDGTWSGPLPRCSNLFIHLLLLFNYQRHLTVCRHPASKERWNANGQIRPESFK